MSTSPSDKEKIAWLEGRIQQLTGSVNVATQPVNIAAMVNAAPNGAGFGHTAAAAIVAVLALPAMYTGIFRWSVKAKVVTVAADVSTWTVTSQRTGTLAAPVVPAFTNSSDVTYAPPIPGTANGFLASPGPAALQAVAATALNTSAAGASIGITGGPFNEKTQYTQADTIGAGATLEDNFEASGFMIDNAAPAEVFFPPYKSTDVFPLGSTVMLCLKYTNTVADRVITGVTMSLEEVRF